MALIRYGNLVNGGCVVPYVLGGLVPSDCPNVAVAAPPAPAHSAPGMYGFQVNGGGLAANQLGQQRKSAETALSEQLLQGRALLGNQLDYLTDANRSSDPSAVILLAMRDNRAGKF